MFIAVLSIISKSRKQPKCSSTGEWKQVGTSTNGILFSCEKQLVIDSHNNTDGSSMHFAK